MDDGQVLKLRGKRFMTAVFATAALGVLSLAVGVAALAADEIDTGIVLCLIGGAVCFGAWRMLGNAYVLRGSVIGYRNGMLGRITRSVDLDEVELVTLAALGRSHQVRLTLWSTQPAVHPWVDRISRMLASDRATVKQLELDLGRLRPMPVDLDLMQPAQQQPIWEAMSRAGLPVEGTQSFPVFRQRSGSSR